MMTSAKALCIGCSTAILLISSAAEAQEACKSYVVVEGDHLRSIARKAYGDPDLYRLIFDANRDVIGGKADLILAGTTLAIPCKPGTEGAEAEVAITDPATDASSATVVDPASEGLATEVIDPAKEPVVILSDIPVATVDEETAPTTEVAVVEEVAPADDQPSETAVAASEATTTEVQPAEDPAATVTEPQPTTEVAVVVEEPAVEPTVAADATAETQPVAEVAAAAETAAPASTAPQEAVILPEEGPIRIVTGNGYAPFADEMLPGGGMFTQIVEMGIFRANPDLPYSLTFINDWQAHIDALLPSQAYDLSFPWMRPNCEAPETLSTGDLARCNDFVFSAPYYEVVDGFFAAADSDFLITSEYTDLSGTRICRPEAYTTGVLEAQGLDADKVTLSRPQEAEACFEALAKGDVDLVSIDTAVGDSILKHMGLAEKFRQNPSLTTVSSLHIIAHKSNARAVAMLKVLDQGVMEMNQSGEWWDIVSEALDKQ